MRKYLFGALLAVALIVGGAAPAFAHDCVNLSKNTSSPTVSFGVGTTCQDQLIPDSIKTGLAQRIDKFGFDQNGDPNFPFHGPTGIDSNCDGVVDATSYSPGNGTGGVIPAAEVANGRNGTLCKGISNFETAVENGCIPAP